MVNLFCARKGGRPLFQFLVVIIAYMAALTAAPLARAKAVSVVIHPQQVRNTINRKIYGQFLEHIYHSGDNGVWGQLIWNRSFEKGDGDWVRRGVE